MPQRVFASFSFTGVLDESRAPTRIGPTGMTACQNVVYRRFGGWGKRAGSTYVYAATAPAQPPVPPTPPSGFSPAPATPPSPPAPPPGAGGSGPQGPRRYG